MVARHFSDRIYQGVFYLAAGLSCAAVFLRTYLIYRDTAVIWQVFGLLLIFWFLFLFELVVMRRRSFWFHLYLAIQTILISLLIYTPTFEVYDYFSNLYAILGMQLMQRIGGKSSVMWIIIFLTLIGIKFFGFDVFMEGLTRFLSFGSIIVFISSYSLATRHAQEATIYVNSLLQQLKDANHKLEQSADTQRNLGIIRERQRLARELHDSVTQNIFSMTLTTQSALLLMDKNPARVTSQLERLNQLAQSAMTEIQVLISELRPKLMTSSELVSALRKLLTEQPIPEGLSVTLNVNGECELPPVEAQGLFRIAQEALNNIIKHSNAKTASIVFHMDAPLWIAINDDGGGFDPQQAFEGGHIGLASMQERAEEIGWDITIHSDPGKGTHIRVEKKVRKEERV